MNIAEKSINNYDDPHKEDSSNNAVIFTKNKKGEQFGVVDGKLMSAEEFIKMNKKATTNKDTKTQTIAQENKEVNNAVITSKDILGNDFINDGEKKQLLAEFINKNNTDERPDSEYFPINLEEEKPFDGEAALNDPEVITNLIKKNSDLPKNEFDGEAAIDFNELKNDDEREISGSDTVDLLESK